MRRRHELALEGGIAMNFRSSAAATLATAWLVACSSSPSSSPSANTGSDGGSSGTASTGSGSSSGSSGGSGSGSGSGGTGTSSGGTTSSGGGGADAGESDAVAVSPDASAADCPAGVVGHCDPGATYPTYPGYTLSLVEDFPGPIDLDNDPVFTWSDGSPEQGQVRFRKEQITFANGNMVITTESTCPSPAAPCIPAGVSYAESAKGANSGVVGAMNVWSGEFRTKYNNYRYGRYEVRYAAPVANPTVPSGGGNFLSTMFVFRTPKWSDWNEIDNELEPSIPLAVGYNMIDATMGATMYPSGNAAAGCAGSGTGCTGTLTGYKNTDTHTYAFEWTPTSVTWFLDGVMIHQFSGSASDPIPTKSAKIMMNLWIFGSSAAFGDPSKNVYPFAASYDYFRFYKLNTETTYPCSPTPSCLTAADTAFSQNNPNEANYPN